MTHLTTVTGFDDGGVTVHTDNLAGQADGLGFIFSQTGGVHAGCRGVESVSSDKPVDKRQTYE